MKWYGNIDSLEGGSACIRSDDIMPPLDLSKYAGLTFDVQCDQNSIFKFGLRDRPFD